jgi:hypothetical protein
MYITAAKSLSISFYTSSSSIHVYSSCHPQKETEMQNNMDKYKKSILNPMQKINEFLERVLWGTLCNRNLVQASQLNIYRLYLK